jgi:cyclopropane fatty-acyl-phospholipid synthase-like methyltransferase
MRLGAFFCKTSSFGPKSNEKVNSMLDFPATHRNREAIAEVLQDVFPTHHKRTVLELASGSGQHVAYFAARFPHWTFQPTDLEIDHIRSIEAYRASHDLSNVLQPKLLNVVDERWPVRGPFDGVLAINLIHISPWECTLGLFAGAAEVLKERGKLFLYGAYRVEGRHTSPSNVAFDQSLQASDPRWGVRCLDEVTEVATKHGFKRESVIKMPANNLSVVFLLDF